MITFSSSFLLGTSSSWNDFLILKKTLNLSNLDLYLLLDCVHRIDTGTFCTDTIEHRLVTTWLNMHGISSFELMLRNRSCKSVTNVYKNPQEQFEDFYVW